MRDLYVAGENFGKAPLPSPAALAVPSLAPGRPPTILAALHMKFTACLSRILAGTLACLTLAAQTAPAPVDPHFQIPAMDDGLPGAGPIRRADWFAKLWSERRSGWAQRVEADQFSLVFL